MSFGTRIAGALSGLLLLTACGSGLLEPREPTPGPVSVPTSSTPAAATSCKVDSKPCTNREVTETGCDVNAVFVVQKTPVVVGQARGQLALRKANPAACQRIFWVHFYPEIGSPADYSLVTAYEEGGQVLTSKEQPSQPGMPEQEAYSVGVHVELGMKVWGCVKSGADEKCVETIAV